MKDCKMKLNQEFEDKFKRLKLQRDDIVALMPPELVNLGNPTGDDALSRLEFMYLLDSILEKLSLIKKDDEEYLTKAERTKEDVMKLQRGNINSNVQQITIYQLLRVNMQLTNILEEQENPEKEEA